MDSYPRPNRTTLVASGLDVVSMSSGHSGRSGPQGVATALGILPDNRLANTEYVLNKFYGDPDSPFFPGRYSRSGQSTAPSFPDASFVSLPRTTVSLDGGTTINPGLAFSDSGYGSKQSVNNHFTYGEPEPSSAETLCSGIPDSQFAASVASSQPAPAPSSTSDGLICSFCNVAVKTKSELRKHIARHTKPHRCAEAGCARGFATLNDLDRHRKSKHSAGGRRYRCVHGACATKDRGWPRADNFRTHLKNVHRMVVSRDADLSKYETERLVPLAHEFSDTLSSVGGAPALNETYKPEESRCFQWSDPRAEMDGIAEAGATDDGHVDKDQDCCSVSTDKQAEIKTTCYFDEGHGRLEDDVALSAMLSPDCLNDGTFRGQDMTQLSFMSDLLDTVPGISADYLADVMDGYDGDAAYVTDAKDARLSLTPIKEAEAKEAWEQTDSNQASESGKCAQEDDDLFLHATVLDDDTAYRLVRGLEARGMLNGLVQRLGYHMVKTSTPSSETEEDVKPLVGPIACPELGCGKSFPRQCDLTKHKKRHEKPYACTRLPCRGRFGSNNDWKRHETMQHEPVEMWRCDVAAGPDRVCGKAFDHGDDFRQHLGQDHEMQDEEVVEQKSDTCHVGHSKTSFWCGFCTDIVETGVKSTSRFSHIEDHFFGRHDLHKRDISEWKTMGQVSSAKASPSLDESAQPRTRRKTVPDVVAPKAKRQKLCDKGVLFWICCDCCEINMVKTTEVCLTCGMRRCVYCALTISKTS